MTPDLALVELEEMRLYEAMWRMRREQSESQGKQVRNTAHGAWDADTHKTRTLYQPEKADPWSGDHLGATHQTT